MAVLIYAQIWMVTTHAPVILATDWEVMIMGAMVSSWVNVVLEST